MKSERWELTMCKFDRKSGDTRIDPCMRTVIKMLNHHKIETQACCCGHGKYHMTIVAKLLGGTYEMFTGSYISRKKKFYKRNKQGHYYIPETLNTTKDNKSN